MRQHNLPSARRLMDDGTFTKRWHRFFLYDVPRHIRCYDNGSATIDRYTVIFTVPKTIDKVPYYPYIGMSARPYHPQGICQHGNGIGHAIDKPKHDHLGERINFAALPLDCQYCVLCDYCHYWNVEFDDHPLVQIVDACAFGMTIRSDEMPWIPGY